MQRKYKQAGIGLVEIMVALVISSLLVVGVIQIFMSNRQAYDMQGELARLQEGGRFAFQFLGQDLRMAGYMGCSRFLDAKSNLNDSGNYKHNLNGEPLLGGYVDGGTLKGAGLLAENGLDATELGTLVDGTDVVLIRRAGEGAVEMDSPWNVGATTHVKPPHNFRDGDIIMISDCTNAHIVQVTGTKSGSSVAVVHNPNQGAEPGNSGHKIDHPYGEGAMVSHMLNLIYYVAENPDGDPALYRKVGSADGEELLAGVENFRLSYGLDIDGDGDLDTDYLTAQQIDASATRDWPQVIAVRMDVLFRGDRDTLVDTSDGQSLVFNSAVENYKDGFLRQGMSSAVTVRNRVP